MIACRVAMRGITSYDDWDPYRHPCSVCARVSLRIRSASLGVLALRARLSRIYVPIGSIVVAFWDDHIYRILFMNPNKELLWSL